MNNCGAEPEHTLDVLSFEYPEQTDAVAKHPGGWKELTFETLGSADPVIREVSATDTDASIPGTDSETLERSFQAGRHLGLEEGRKAERAEMLAELAEAECKRKKQIVSTLQQFSERRDVYLQEIEREVVDLALGIAARILRREAQMDPLLLSGAVRAALTQLGQTTEVRVLVPISDASLWNESFAHVPNLAMRPEVVADEGMSTGECTIETRIGSVDLGLRAQLAEIEKGFFDRRQHSGDGRLSGTSMQVEKGAGRHL